MLGAIIGDIVGSRFEFDNHRSKDFSLFTNECFFTDDSVMTLAIAKAIMSCNGDYNDLANKAIFYMQNIGKNYPNCGFGGHFRFWIFDDNKAPYGSFGNGAAMRISSIGDIASSIEEVKDLSRKVTEVTHNHPEGLKGAEATAIAIYLARHKYNIDEIREYINKHYYKLDFKLDDIRPTYRFFSACQNSVPQAIVAFLESTSFEDAIRNAISIGGDSDTIAAIAGSIAEAYYGIPNDIRAKALTYLDKRLLDIVLEYELAVSR